MSKPVRETQPAATPHCRKRQRSLTPYQSTASSSKDHEMSGQRKRAMVVSSSESPNTKGKNRRKASPRKVLDTPKLALKREKPKAHKTTGHINKNVKGAPGTDQCPDQQMSH